MTDTPPPRWTDVGTVALGGALGTAAREAVSLAFPAADGIPYAILGVNLAGALLLGLLFGAAGRLSAARARQSRLLLGTGVLGGFTTYSALAGDSARLWESSPAVAVGYAILSLVAGVAAAGLGLWLGERVARGPGGRP